MDFNYPSKLKEAVVYFLAFRIAVPMPSKKIPESPTPSNDLDTYIPDSWLEDSLVGANELESERTFLIEKAVQPKEMVVTSNEERRFTNIDLLGKGGMGYVHQAYDHSLHRSVAVKSLINASSSQTPAWKRFFREAQITAQLSHPSIVPVHSLEFENDGQPRLVMKMIEGQTLKDSILECSKNNQHSLSSRIEWLIKVCDAVFYAHSRKVLHRDLKPENIMVGRYKEVYVMDWGISRVIGDVEEQFFDENPEDSLDIEDLGVKTMDGVVFGTPLYMSPEQAIGDQEAIGYTSDQYSIGMILYELVTLKSPRSGDTIAELLTTAIKGVQPDINISGEMDLRLQSIILKATEPTPSQRYTSVRELAQDLRRFLRGESVLAHPENVIMKTFRYSQRHPITSISLISVTVVFALLSSLFALLSTLNNKEMLLQRQESTALILGAVSVNAREIDGVFASMQQLVNALSTAAHVHSLNLKKDIGGCTSYEQLPSKPGAKAHSRYNNLIVSVREATCLAAPGVDLDDSWVGFSLGAVLQDHLISLLQKEDAFSIFEQKFWTSPEEFPIHYAYLGVKDGTLINYPGEEYFGEDYDPRLRPWYLAGIQYESPQCDLPYPDSSGSGFLMPCNQQILDKNGEVLGVVGIDIAMDSVIEIMEELNLENVERSFILNDSLEIILDANEKGQKLTSKEALSGHLRKETNDLHEEVLITELERLLPNGIVLTEDSVFSYFRLQFVPWTLVVQLNLNSLDYR